MRYLAVVLFAAVTMPCAASAYSHRLPGKRKARRSSQACACSKTAWLLRISSSVNSSNPSA